MEKAIDRIYKYLKNKRLAPTNFEKKIGLSNGYLGTQKKRKANIGEKSMNKIINYCLDINPEWLLTGKGEMLRQPPAELSEPKPEMGVPLVSVEAVGGFGSADFSISEQDIKAYYVIPDFKPMKVDFMIRVQGSSMYPKYSSGDVVACSIIRESTFIQWNKTHVIATKEQGIIIKRIKEGECVDNLLMVSDNKDYDAFLVPKEDVTGIALVVGVIRLE